MNTEGKKKESPSIEAWMKEAKQSTGAGQSGMYLIHNGVVRETAREKVREGKEDALPVRSMEFSYDDAKVQKAIEETYQMPGIQFIRVWLNEGVLKIGDDIMYVMIGGDIRPHVIDALQSLVGTIKTSCVIEKEVY